MKKTTTKLLALLLTMVMVLSAAPFAMADELTPAVEITCTKDAVWPGETVTLRSSLSGFGDYSAEYLWDTGDGIGDRANYTLFAIPADASGSVTASLTVDVKDGSQTVGQASDSITLKVNEAAGSDFTVSGVAEARVGETVTFSTSGENDSDVTYAVEGDATIGASSGKFKANAAGTYTVTATAKNGGKVEAVTDTTTITVTEAEYRVNLVGGTFALSEGTAALSYSITATADGSEVMDAAPTFSSSNTSVATVDDKGVLTMKKKGETTITMEVVLDGETYSDEADITVSDSGAITCAQDMSENGDDSLDMTFVLKGITSDNVSWNVSVSGEEEFSVSKSSFTDDTTATVTVTAEDGNGVAAVRVSAQWGEGGEASATFYASFYVKNDFSVELADGVDEFTFDENGVFSRVDGNPTGAAKKSLHSLITDGAGTRVIFTENDSGNDRVGEISYDGGSTFTKYDPDDENDYALSNLENLVFEVRSGGEYELDFEVYDGAGGQGLATSKGTITIITGDTTSDISYSCVTGGTVKLDAEDFEEFWEDNCDEEDEDLNYVTFEVATSSDMDGTLYHDGKELKAAWKCYVDFDEDKHTYDLEEVTYKASSVTTGTDTVTFVCYGEDGTKISGIAAFKVTNGRMSFTDVTSADWFYDEVLYVYSNGIMNGTTDTTFAPNDTLTRGMVVTMLYRVEGEPATSTSGTFTDVPSGQWYTEAVEWAARNDIVNGVGDGKFAPNTAITREQLAAILYRYAKYDDQDVSVGEDTNILSYDDATSVSEYAVSALQWACGEGIITGDSGRLMPQGNATRAQAAAMFSRFMQ